MSNVATAVEAWEGSVKGLELATRAMGATVKMLQEARSNAVLTKSWDAVEAVRSAMVATQEEEATKFGHVIDSQRQTTMEFPDGKPKAKAEGSLEQVPLGLPAAPNARGVEDALENGAEAPAVEEDEVEAAFDDENEDEDHDDDAGKAPRPGHDRDPEED